MDIYFKDSSGNRVGFVIGTDIKDNSGNRVGYIEGDTIKDNSGSRVGYIEGSSFKDNYGARVGYIEGNNIKDIYGARIGYPETDASSIEMCAAAFLLFGLEVAQQTTRQAPPSRKKPDSDDVFGWILYVIVGIILFVLPAYINNIKYFKYTAARKEFWGTLGRLFGFTMILAFIGLLGELGGIGGSIYGGLMAVPIILVSIRRMRDIGKPWWWILIPIVNFFMCAFVPGKD